MKPKHTPGPYTIHDKGYGAEIRGSDGKGVAWLGGERENYMDNARLFAASPELLAALTRLAIMHRRHYGLDGAWDEEIQAAEAAIKKAGAK